MTDYHRPPGPVHGFAMDAPPPSQPSRGPGVLDALRQGKTGRRALSILTALLFLAGAGMFSYPFFTDLYTHEVIQKRLADEFETITVQTFDEWKGTVQEGRALTELVMPKLKVKTLVVEGTSPAALRAGAGHYPNTPLPGSPRGNVAIAGHRTTYGKPFNQLDKLALGDRIWLRTPVCDCEYAVARPPKGWNSNPHITHPQDWQVIAPTPEPSLTLTTCHPKGSAAQRLVVRAQLVRAHPPGTYARQTQT